jgi:hypothetical protein
VLRRKPESGSKGMRVFPLQGFVGKAVIPKKQHPTGQWQRHSGASSHVLRFRSKWLILNNKMAANKIKPNAGKL